MIVAGLLGTCPSVSKRAAWKSSMKICACSSDVVHPLAFAGLLALEQRRQDAERAEQPGGEIGDRNADAHRAPPGAPVIDISPPMPCAIWSKPGRLA